MTWIIPLTLQQPICRSAPAMAGLTLDSPEFYPISAQSLTVSGKHLRSQTFSARLSKEPWTRLLSGRILSPSHGQTFVAWWTSSLADIPASHSAKPDSGEERKIQDISSLGSWKASPSCDPATASSRMSKDTSSEDFKMFSETWSEKVMRLRGECLQRKKSATLINGGESSSLRNFPTPTASDYRTDRLKSTQQKPGSMHSVNLGQAVRLHWVINPGSPLVPEITPEPLNPDERLSPIWVEMLMGLPEGWSSPNELIGSTSSATESFRK